MFLSNKSVQAVKDNMNYIRPEQHELREAREVVEGTLESCEHVVEKEDDLEISLSHAEMTEAEDFGVFGGARSSEHARLYFNTRVKGWKDNLEDLTADTYGQSFFHENSEVNFQWQQILASVTGLMVIEKISDPRKVEKEDFREEWAEKKTEISEEIDSSKDNLSWQLKALIGRKLLERHDLEEFPELKRGDVLDAGDAIFD